VSKEPFLEPGSIAALEFEAVLEHVARHAGGALGAEVVRAARPRADREEVEVSLGEAREALERLAAGEEDLLVGSGDPRAALDRLSKGDRALEPTEILSLGDFLESAESARRELGALAARYPRLALRASGIPDVADLRARLRRSVRADGSVPDGASPRLARIRSAISRVEQEIASKLESVLARPAVRRHLQSPVPVRRDGRALLAVRSTALGRVRGLLHERSGSGATAFLEPEELVEPGNRLADLRTRESREVAAVLLDVTRTLVARQRDLAEVRARIGALDAADAKARWGRETGGTIPAIAEGRGLELRRARHPLLLEGARVRGAVPSDVVVPIDLRVGDGFDLLLLTGPNTGGKTVALKTAGILVLLALSGFPVPAAEGARVPRYDAFFVDIGDEQEIAQSLSTFSSHLRRILPALDRSTERSLVLLDELGSGTDPVEGAALARAILDHLLARRASVIATTHLGPLKTFAALHPSAENASVEFDVETLRPTFRVRLGIAGESNAIRIAERLGLPAPLVSRAMESVEAETHPLEGALRQVDERRREAEDARERVHRMEDEAGRLAEDLATREKEIDRARDRLEVTADAVLGESFRRAKRVLAEEVRRALAGTGPIEARLDRLRERVEEALGETPLRERRLEFFRNLRRGDLVLVRSLRRRVPVRKIEIDRARLSVSLGSVRLEIVFDDVVWPEPIAGDAPERRGGER